MTTEKTSTRVYVVEIEGERPRLVRATYGHIAERHVIGQLVSSRIPTKDDLIELMTQGVRVEDAGEPDPGGNGQDDRQQHISGLSS